MSGLLASSSAFLSKSCCLDLSRSLILNIAACAIQEKNELLAVEYYKKLTDVNVTGSDYKELYQFIVDYYVKNDDQKSEKSIADF
mgnify:CR=1 FL=1